MKIIAAFLFSILATAANHCVSHGQCQSIADESTACYLIKTGANSCEQRCFTIYAGSYCNFIPGQSYGTCKDEDYKAIQNNKNDCSNAIPEKIANEIF